MKPGGHGAFGTSARRKLLAWGHKAYMKMDTSGDQLDFGHRWPKDYLAETIENFPAPRTLCQQMRWAF